MGLITEDNSAAIRAWADCYDGGLIALLREARTWPGVASDADLARKLSLSPATLSNILGANRRAGPADLPRIGVGLGLSPAQLFREAEAAHRREQAGDGTQPAAETEADGGSEP